MDRFEDRSKPAVGDVMQNLNSETLRSAVAALPGAVAIAAADGDVLLLVYVNAAFERLTGRDSSELLGQSLLHALGSDNDQAALTGLAAALRSDRDTRFETRCRQRDGTGFWSEISVSPELIGRGIAAFHAVTLADVSERRTMLDAVAAERDRLLRFVESVPLGILALDSVMSGIVIADARKSDLPLIYVNAAFERLSGYTAEELLGRQWSSVLSEDRDRRDFDEVRKGLVDNREVRVELRSPRKDGSLFWNELYLSPVLDDHGELSHYLGIVTDISDRKETQRKLEDLTEALRRNRDDLVSILNQFPSGTLVLDADGTLAFASASCRTAIGIEPAGSVGHHWRRVLPLDAGAADQVQSMLRIPVAERKPLVLQWHDEGRDSHWVECAVKDDPRDASRRLIFLDDVTELRRLRDQLESRRFAGLIGESPPMRELYRMISEVARGDWTALVEGETGTGKELVARGIHEASPRSQRPFIAVNSAGLSESLLASQLFGHRKGAFTGATADQQGFFEAASGGTIFLDEIGDLPLFMQASLLRVLQEHEITRVGETRVRPVDVRVIAATHKDLATEVREGRFREDLLFRLRVARIRIPPLRARRIDIPLLTEHFLRLACRQARKDPVALHQEALQGLLSYDWPGNIRELCACIDYAVIHCRGSSVRGADLPPEIVHAQSMVDTLSETDDERLQDDRTRILSALKKAAGNRSRAAKILQMSRATFYRRLRELGMNLEL